LKLSLSLQAYVVEIEPVDNQRWFSCALHLPHKQRSLGIVPLRPLSLQQAAGGLNMNIAWRHVLGQRRRLRAWREGGERADSHVLDRLRAAVRLQSMAFKAE
jgi:hypothetical protein